MKGTGPSKHSEAPSSPVLTLVIFSPRNVTFRLSQHDVQLRVGGPYCGGSEGMPSTPHTPNITPELALGDVILRGTHRGKFHILATLGTNLPMMPCDVENSMGEKDGPWGSLQVPNIKSTCYSARLGVNAAQTGPRSGAVWGWVCTHDPMIGGARVGVSVRGT